MNNDPIPSLRFTGLFIPAEIMEMDLHVHEMMLLSFIDALHSKEFGGCFASNSYLAKRLKLKENTIAIMIGKLKKLGLVEQISFDGRRRVIRACKEKWFKKNISQSNSDFDSNQTLSFTKIKPGVLPKSNPLIIYNKAESKEETLSISHSGSTDSTAKDKSRECVSLFVEKIKEHDPKFKLRPSKQKSWEQEFLAMHKDDDRSWEQIHEVIIYALEDTFWKDRIFDPAKLRQKTRELITQMAKNKPKDDPLKSKQDIIDKNQDYTRNAVSFLPQKYFVIYTDTIKFTLETETITLYYEDPNFRNQLKTIIDKINRDL